MLQQQLFLPGFERSKARNGVFFAVMPPPPEALRFAGFGEQIRRQLGLTGRLQAQETLHVSLHGIEEYEVVPPSVIELAKKAGDAISAQPCHVVFDTVMSFYRNVDDRPLVLCASDPPEALLEFHRLLGDAMKRAGFCKISAHFKPHLTLLYDHHLVAKRAIDDMRMTVQSFDLIVSLRGRGHTRYKHLARWPLHG